jgi:quinol monooxygenase YgiN
MIRDEKGCLDCHTYRDVEDEEVLFLSVQWKSRTSLEHYMQSESGSALVGAIDLLSETARVGFDRDSRREGINALKKLRKKTSK